MFSAKAQAEASEQGVWWWSRSEWSFWYMELLPNFKQCIFCSLYSFHFLSSTSHMVFFFIQQVYMNQLPVYGRVSTFLTRASPRKNCNSWSSASPLPPYPINSVAQPSCQGTQKICGLRYDFSHAYFHPDNRPITFCFPVHFLIWPATLWIKH